MPIRYADAAIGNLTTDDDGLGLIDAAGELVLHDLDAAADSDTILRARDGVTFEGSANVEPSADVCAVAPSFRMLRDTAVRLVGALTGDPGSRGAVTFFVRPTDADTAGITGACHEEL